MEKKKLRSPEQMKIIIMDRLDYFANMFKLIGNGTTENPRWMILYYTWDDDMRKGMKLESSQKKLGWEFDFTDEEIQGLEDTFDIEVSYNASIPHDAWFREARNKHLAEHHPTIELYNV